MSALNLPCKEGMLWGPLSCPPWERAACFTQVSPQQAFHGRARLAGPGTTPGWGVHYALVY